LINANNRILTIKQVLSSCSSHRFGKRNEDILYKKDEKWLIKINKKGYPRLSKEVIPIPLHTLKNFSVPSPIAEL
tara:strand:- start:905 stop:1129 length:225 start_codon:yes stop_codon:yes gene_type:complete